MASRQHIRFCTTDDGVRLAYATAGAGPAVVKSAAWLSHLDHDLDGPAWGPLLQALHARHLVLRYDPRGSGLSDRDVEQVSFERQVADLEAVVEAAQVGRFAMLGISQGAGLAIAYTQRHPDRVSRLVLLGGCARGRMRRGGGAAADEEARMLQRIVELGWGQDDAAFRQVFTMQFVPGGTREERDWFDRMQRVITTPRNAARLLAVLHETDVSHLLADIACPTLVLHAVDDPGVPFAEGRLLAERIAGARLVALASRNHLLMPGEPAWQHACDEILAFLGDAQDSQAAPAGRYAALTPREAEVLELVAQGRDNAQVAATLHLSEKTVRNHITRIFAKLEVANRAQAIVAARSAGFGMTRAS
jgi:pimeloyl-ACP methyl ester carboxylesterase/DNA-binding CsgD family transcriptional regulator